LDLLHQWSPLLLEDQWQQNGDGKKMIGDATSRRCELRRSSSP